MVELGSWESV